MVTCICIIKANKEIIGYRLFDIETLGYKDVSEQSALQNIDKIGNLIRVKGSIETLGCQDNLYPVYDRITGEVYNGDKLVYVGRTDIDITNEKGKQRYINNRILNLRSRNVYNNVCKWDGTVYSIQADYLQEGIINKNCLNVVEGYTGGLNIPALISYGDIVSAHFSYNHTEVLHNICFCSIREMYELHGKFKQADIIHYKGALYNIAEHKRTNSSVIKGRDIVSVYHCGIIYGYQDREFKYKGTREKLPLYIEDDKIYYVAQDKQVMEDSLYGYIGCGLDGVFNKSKLLDTNREASFCIISANKIYVLAMGMLEELDRDTCMDKIGQAMKVKGRFLSKLKLVGNTDIGVDDKGRVTGYRLRKEVNCIDITGNIEEFNLSNISVDDSIKQKYDLVYVDLNIQDKHGLVYVSGKIPGNIYFGVLRCNDIQLGKKLMEHLTMKFKRRITWEIYGNKITLGLVKWAYSKWAYTNKNNDIQYIIKIKPVGDLKVKTKDAIVEFLFSDKVANMERTKEDIKWLNKHRNDIGIVSAVPIYIGDYVDNTYGYRLKYSEIVSANLKIGNIKEDGDVYYSGCTYVYGMTKHGLGKELVVSDKGDKINLAEGMGIGIKVKLAYIDSALSIIKLPCLRLEAFRYIDERIDNVYKSLTDLYTSRYEHLAENNQISAGGGVISLLFGCLYKRDIGREYKIIYVKSQDNIEEVIYLKYIKYKMSKQERNKAEQSILIADSHSKNKKNKCGSDIEEHIQSSLPDEIWVSLTKLFGLQGRIYAGIANVEEALGIQVHIQDSGIIVWDRMQDGYLPNVIYKGYENYAEINRHMVEIEHR